MKIMNSIMLMAFILSAFVQYNDPDPINWIAIYGMAALTCFIFIVSTISWIVPALIGALALIWAGYLLPSLIENQDTVPLSANINFTEMKTYGTELIREIGGLLIVVCWMGVLSFKKYAADKADA